MSRSFAEVAAELLKHAETVCAHLLPGGRKVGTEWVAGNLAGTRGRSLSVNLREGVWKDFATGACGADLINLWAAVRSIPQSAAKREAEEWLGLPPLPTKPHAPAPQRPVVVRPVPPQPAILEEPEEEASEREPAVPGMIEPPDESDHFWWQRLDIKPTKVWDYFSVDGELVAQVYRFDHPEKGKAIRPWNPKTLRWEAPKDRELRPLLYLPEIVKASSSTVIVICEGEKAADAVREAGYIATTCMGGAQAVTMADWSPLAGRKVVYWRDKDQGGRYSEQKLIERLREVQVAACHLVKPPLDAPVGFDAADADVETRRALIEQALRAKPVVIGRPRLVLAEWCADRYTGAAPERKMLVDGVFPMGSVSILAGMGGIGKGLVGVTMAYHVAYGEPSLGNPPKVLGGRVMQFGRAVVLAGEDTASELHRRLVRIDRENLREKHPDRLFLVPLPSTGGNFPLIRTSSKGLEITEHYDRLRDELAAIEDLKLVMFDPLSRFAAANVERDIDASQMFLGALGSLAAELNIAIILAHHMVKMRTMKDVPVVDATNARDAVRGTTGLVDGVRSVYALWPEHDANKARDMLERAGWQPGIDEWRNTLVWGAVVKSNGPHDKTVRAYARDEAGMLVDITYDLQITADDAPSAAAIVPVLPEAPPRKRVSREEYKAMIVEAVRLAEKYGQAFNATGSKSLYGRSGLLDEPLRRITKREMEKLLTELINSGRILYTKHQPLGVPGGPLSTGTYAPADVHQPIKALAERERAEQQ